jgi:hypothetical protein
LASSPPPTAAPTRSNWRRLDRFESFMEAPLSYTVGRDLL